VIVMMVAAFASVIAITRWQQHSAHALGKVTAVISATAAFAEAWSKTQKISERLADDPTRVSLPAAEAPEPRESALVPRNPYPEDDDVFVPPHRTGGLRGFSAYSPVR